LIPKGWETLKVKDLCDLQRGRLVRAREIEDNPGPYPVYRVPDRYNGVTEHLGSYDFEGNCLTWVLFGTRAGEVFFRTGRFSCTPLWGILRPRTESVDMRFLSYVLSAVTSRYVTPGRIPQLTIHAIAGIPISLPPLKEQRKITGVLARFDETLELAEQGIEEARKLRDGLIEELLTKGMGHRAFKQTGLGSLPKEWAVKELNETAGINIEWINPQKNTPDREFRYLDLYSVETGTGALKTPVGILGKDAPARARRVVHKGDVILSAVEPYLKRAALIPAEYDGLICSTDFMVLTPKPELDPGFLLSVLCSEGFIGQCRKRLFGGRYPSISSTQLGKVLVPIPPEPEQREIARMVGSLFGYSKLLKERKDSLEEIRKGVLGNLVSGKAMVRDL
jgi:type I restriction enzyme S subunit